MINENRIILERGIWMPFAKDSYKRITYDNMLMAKHYERCTSLFNVIPINPYGEILACCGLTCENNRYLRLGNIRERPIKEIYESSFCGLLKISLFVDGPSKMLDLVEKLKCTEVKERGVHICDICRSLFMDNKNIELLKENYDKFATNIILKYQLLTNKYENEKKI